MDGGEGVDNPQDGDDRPMAESAREEIVETLGDVGRLSFSCTPSISALSPLHSLSSNSTENATNVRFIDVMSESIVH